MKEEQTFFRAFLALSMYIFVSSASASTDNDSSKPLIRLRNDQKSVKRNMFTSQQEYDPFIGLAGLYDDEKRIAYAPMSMILDESTLPSSQPTSSLEPTPSPSLKTTSSPTIDDPNFGKVEGKRRISSASVGLELTMSAIMILVVSMLVA